MGTLRRYATTYQKSQPDLYRALLLVDDEMSNVKAHIGIDLDFVDNPLQAVGAKSSGVPQGVQFGVIGVDGKYEVTIINPQSAVPQSVGVMLSRVLSNPNARKSTIVHNLQSATDTNFSNDSGVTDYGISSVLTYHFQDPNVTKFWRLRSSYDGTTWTGWQIYASVLTCGPVGVQSGALRSTSMLANPQLNISNFATVDSIDNGVNATIRVYGPGGVGTSFQRIVGSSHVGPDGTPNTVYPAGTLVGFTYNFDYYVMFDTVTLLYSVVDPAANYPDTLPDTSAFVGTLHTVSAGGGGGTGGGGGNGGGGGGGRTKENR